MKGRCEMNIRQKVAVGITDILVLVELCISLYVSSHDPDNFSSVFFRYFFSMFFPTVALAWFSIRRLAPEGSR